MTNVLIVDDCQLILRGLEKMIDWESVGYKIVGKANNGKEALRLLEINQIDIMLTDIKMPVMDGLELIGICKDKYPDLKIGVLSAYDDYDSVRAAFLAGVKDYLLKQEYDADLLIQFLEKIGNGKKKVSDEEVEIKDTSSRYFSRFRKCIEKHYAEKDLKAQEVAEYLGISVGYLGKIIFKETGIHFSDYMNQYRVEKAKELLVETNLKIYEIAENVGYNNVEHFNRIFKKMTGVGPRQYAEMRCNEK